MLDTVLGQPPVERVDIFNSNAGVPVSPEAEDRAGHPLDLLERHRRSVGLPATGRKAIEADGRDVLTFGRDVEGQRPAHTKADRADETGRIGALLQPVEDDVEIAERLALVESLDSLHGGLACRICDRSLAKEEVRQEGLEPGQCEPPTEVLVKGSSSEDVADDQGRSALWELRCTKQRRHHLVPGEWDS